MLKKLIILCLSSALALTGLVGRVGATNKVTSISNPKTGYYGTLELVYTNSVSSKFIVTEFENGSYTLEFVKSEDGSFAFVLINNIKYSIEDYNAMTMEQANHLNSAISPLELEKDNSLSLLDFSLNYVGEVNTIDYAGVNQQLRENNKVDHDQHSTGNSNLRCNGCRQYTPYSPPTSGYNDYPSSAYFVIKNKPSSILVSLQASSIAALAASACNGFTDDALVVMTFFVEYAAGEFLNKLLDIDYGFMQTYHPICPRAYAERRKFYGTDPNGKIFWSPDVFEYFFYGSNPF